METRCGGYWRVEWWSTNPERRLTFLQPTSYVSTFDPLALGFHVTPFASSSSLVSLLIVMKFHSLLEGLLFIDWVKQKNFEPTLNRERRPFSTVPANRPLSVPNCSSGNVIIFNSNSQWQYWHKYASRAYSNTVNPLPRTKFPKIQQQVWLVRAERETGCVVVIVDRIQLPSSLKIINEWKSWEKIRKWFWIASHYFPVGFLISLFNRLQRDKRGCCE